MATIVVEGPIGVGKTSLCRYLASKLGARMLLEVVEENPFLAGFYREPFAQLEPRVPRPDLVVYLRADPELLLTRIARRGRPFEQAVDPDYLARVSRAYDDVFRPAPYRGHVVEAGEVDYVTDEADRRALLDELLGLARAA